MQVTNIPDERKAVLIGQKGQDKKRIEKATKTKIVIGDSVTIEGDPLACLKAGEIIKAVGRGFSPRAALWLAKDDIVLIIIPLDGSAKTIKRLMGRVIGSQGKAKEYIEENTNTKLSVYGKTVSIIGEYKDAEVAEKSVKILLAGKTHKYAYSHLNKK